MFIDDWVVDVLSRPQLISILNLCETIHALFLFATVIAVSFILIGYHIPASDVFTIVLVNSESRVHVLDSISVGIPIKTRLDQMILLAMRVYPVVHCTLVPSPTSCIGLN